MNTRIAPWLWLWVVLTAVVPMLSACKSEETETDLPKMQAIESRLPDKSSPPHQQPTADSISLRVLRVSLPLQTSLDEAWALTSPGELPPEFIAMWQRNGIRLGTITREQYPEFAKAVGPEARANTSEFISASQYLPLQVAPRLKQLTEITIAEHPTAPAFVETLEEGIPQWLVRFHPSAAGGIMLDVVPHLYYRTQRFEKTDSPFERVTEGRIFEALKLVTRVELDRLVVIGWSAKPQAAEEVRLGDLLLTRVSGKKETQYLLIIGPMTKTRVADGSEIERQMQEEIRRQRLEKNRPQSRP